MRGRGDLRVLGVDPGTRVVGWGVVEQSRGRLRCVGHGAIRVPDRLPVAERLARLAAGLREVVRAHGPEEAALEEAFHGRDARAALRIGEGRGMALVVLAEAGIPVTGYANNVVKRAVTGAGRAAKERVQGMVTRLLALGEPPTPLDASDALALALCHHQRRAWPGAGSAAPGLPPRIEEALRRAREEDRRRSMT